MLPPSSSTTSVTSCSDVSTANLSDHTAEDSTTTTTTTTSQPVGLTTLSETGHGGANHHHDTEDDLQATPLTSLLNRTTTELPPPTDTALAKTAAPTTTTTNTTTTTTTANPMDTLHEIYWYILQDRGNLAAEDLTLGHVIACLEEEGLWFWRDDRFRECQNVALELVGAKRSKFSGKIAEVDREKAQVVPLDFDTFSKFVTSHASLFLKVSLCVCNVVVVVVGIITTTQQSSADIPISYSLSMQITLYWIFFIFHMFELLSYA